MKGQSLPLLADALASLVNRRLTWIVQVTAIITPCVLPQVVGEVTSSVTVTALPEVYLLPKAGWNDGRFRPGVDGPSRGPGRRARFSESPGPRQGACGTVAVNFAREYSWDGALQVRSWSPVRLTDQQNPMTGGEAP
jgi:hypothetical protein